MKTFIKETEKKEKEYKKEAEKTKQIYETSMIRTVYENVRKDFDEDKDAIRYVAKIFSTTSKKVGEALETNI